MLVDDMKWKSHIGRALRSATHQIWSDRISYSAAGEDRIVLAWLRIVYRADIRRLRYLDIGANHPIELSNTFLLYSLGASGVLVEPDPDLCRLLASKRPRDTVRNVGCAFDERRSAKLKRLTSNVFNTFSDEHAAHAVQSSENWRPDQRQSVVDTIDVRLVPANQILSDHFKDGIDFLSIDAEGVDIKILQSIDLQRFRPKLICIEASDDFSSIMGAAGYEQIARTPDNLIYRLPT